MIICVFTKSDREIIFIKLLHNILLEETRNIEAAKVMAAIMHAGR